MKEVRGQSTEMYTLPYFLNVCLSENYYILFIVQKHSSDLFNYKR